MADPNTPESILARVEIGAPDECWEWTGFRTREYGYGRVKYHGRMTLTHRAVYEILVDPIPDGALILHSCDNPPCCNPAHLRAGTHAENMTDKALRGRANNGAGAAVNRSKTHCPQGHPYDDANTYVYRRPDGRQKRACRTCNRLAVARSKARRQA